MLVFREVSSTRSVERRAFVMRVDEIEDVEEDSEEAHDQQLVPGKRFTCDEFYIRCHFVLLSCC